MSKVSDDRWLSVEEIAIYLGVKRDTIYKWIDRKNMPAHKVGALWKFRKDEIDAWVTSGQAADGPTKNGTALPIKTATVKIRIRPIHQSTFVG